MNEIDNKAMVYATTVKIGPSVVGGGFRFVLEVQPYDAAKLMNMVGTEQGVEVVVARVEKGVEGVSAREEENE